MSVPETPAPSLADAGAATRAMFDAPDTPVVADTPPVDALEGTPPAPEAAPETPAPPTPLSWDSIDLSVLPEDVRKVVEDGHLRHADYTRKTQELAEQRKQFEQFGDPETVTEAMAFVQNLQDPDFLRQLNADIETHLANLGGQPPASPTEPQQAPGLDPAISRDIAELKAWRAEQEHQRQEAVLVDEMTQKLQTSEDAIRADYPSYTQSDIDAIYKLSPGVGFDLFEAQKQYEEFRNHFTKGLIGNKDQIPQVANNVRSDALYSQNDPITDFARAREASKALFAAEE